MRWEHFHHEADIGVRGVGATPAEAFEQAGLALTAVMVDPAEVRQQEHVGFECEAPALEYLLVDFLNEIVYAAATRKLIFGRYQVEIDGSRLTAKAYGEPVDRQRHRPAVEVKGATLTALRVGQEKGGEWVAQCVVDV